MEVQLKFRTLESLGRIVVGLGWVVLIVGVIAGMFMETMEGGSRLIGIIVVVAALVQGILVIAAGEVIRCLVAIEHNTRTTALRGES